MTERETLLAYEKGMDNQQKIQLPDGVRMDCFGGILSVQLMVDIWQERLYEYVGRNAYVANYTLKPESEAYKKYGADFTGTIVYTQKEREALEQTYQSGSKTHGMVRFKETNYQLTEEQIKSLREEGINITDIAFVYAIPMPRENLYVKDAVRKPHRLEIPLPSGISYRQVIGAMQHIYEECVRGNRELCPHEWNDYLAVKLLYCPQMISEDEKQKSHDEDGHIKDDIALAMIRTKKEIEGELTDQEQEALEILERRENARKIITFKTALQGSGTDFKQMKQKQPNQTAKLIEELLTFHPIRLNTLAHRHAIYLDLEGYLHLLLRHVIETSVESQPIADKTKLMWNFEDIKYALKGVIGVIADEYDEKRDKQTGRIYWSGDKDIEFCGDYYALQIAPNGRIDTWYRRKNNLLGK